MPKKLIKCLLCGHDNVPSAKSHIYPRGFYSFHDGKQKLVIRGDGTGHWNPNGIYDDSIVCRDCEQKHFSVDNYAILILKQLDNGIRTVIDGHTAFVFPEINRRLLRKFFASFLWRCHVSKNEFVKHICIGDYEQRIREDLLKDGQFDYVDAWCMYLESPIHDMETGVNRWRFDNGVNGYRIQLPHLLCCVSLDKRPIPGIVRINPEIPQIGKMAASTSLASDSDGSAWILIRELLSLPILANDIRALQSQATNPRSRKRLAAFTRMCEREGDLIRTQLPPSALAFLGSLEEPEKSSRATH